MSALHTEILPEMPAAQRRFAATRAARPAEPASRTPGALLPAAVILLGSPVSVLVTLLAGGGLLAALHRPLFGDEMAAAGIASTAGGLLASLPLLIRARHGAQAIAQAGLLGIAIRAGVVLTALLLLLGTGALSPMPLVYWVLACYFPLLMVETATISWLSYKAEH